MPKSPLAIVSERFKNKAALIDAVKALATDDLWIDRLNEDKGLPRISNRKLVHLHDVLTQVKKEHGSRNKLIDAILESSKRGKDAGYRTRLEKQSTPALFSMLTVSKKSSFSDRIISWRAMAWSRGAWPLGACSSRLRS